MSITWKSGVKIQANRLNGSVGLAGSRGGIGVGVGTGPDPDRRRSAGRRPR